MSFPFPETAIPARIARICLPKDLKIPYQARSWSGGKEKLPESFCYISLNTVLVNFPEMPCKRFTADFLDVARRGTSG